MPRGYVTRNDMDALKATLPFMERGGHENAAERLGLARNADVRAEETHVIAQQKELRAQQVEADRQKQILIANAQRLLNDLKTQRKEKEQLLKDEEQALINFELMHIHPAEPDALNKLGNLAFRYPKGMEVPAMQSAVSEVRKASEKAHEELNKRFGNFGVDLKQFARANPATGEFDHYDEPAMEIAAAPGRLLAMRADIHAKQTALGGTAGNVGLNAKGEASVSFNPGAVSTEIIANTKTAGGSEKVNKAIADFGKLQVEQIPKWARNPEKYNPEEQRLGRDHAAALGRGDTATAAAIEEQVSLEAQRQKSSELAGQTQTAAKTLTAQSALLARQIKEKRKFIDDLNAKPVTLSKEQEKLKGDERTKAMNAAIEERASKHEDELEAMRTKLEGLHTGEYSGEAEGSGAGTTGVPPASGKPIVPNATSIVPGASKSAKPAAGESPNPSFVNSEQASESGKKLIITESRHPGAKAVLQEQPAATSSKPNSASNVAWQKRYSGVDSAIKKYAPFAHPKFIETRANEILSSSLQQPDNSGGLSDEAFKESYLPQAKKNAIAEQDAAAQALADELYKHKIPKAVVEHTIDAMNNGEEVITAHNPDSENNPQPWPGIIRDRQPVPILAPVTPEVPVVESTEAAP